jgi:hypothetical protein
MAARPEVVALLTDFDLQRTGSGQRLVHRDGTPFTTEETDPLGSATDDDMHAAASELAAAPERLAELFMPSIRTVAEQLSDHPPTTETPRAASSTAGLAPSIGTIRRERPAELPSQWWARNSSP